MYHKARFTPRRWNSEDGRYTFYMSENGSIDILPGPRSEIMNMLYKAYPEYAKIMKSPKPHDHATNHVHWAYDKTKHQD